jgi:putative methyltransferase (TIGR04325 family)
VRNSHLGQWPRSDIEMKGNVGLKQISKKFIPPILLDIKNIMISGTKDNKADSTASEWEYVSDRWVDCFRGQPVRGWNADGVVSTLTKMWPRFNESITAPNSFGLSNEAVIETKPDIGFHNNVMTYALVLSLVSRDKTCIRVLDWGGGIGHYYKIAKSLFPDLRLEYTCKDMPKICAVGRRICPEVRFVSKEMDCLQEKYDLVMASTSLHYNRDWQRVLSCLIACANGYIFINRLPVVETVPSYVMIQRPCQYGYETEYLGWCVNRSEFLDEARHAGAILQRVFLCADGNNIIIPGAPEQACYHGFLFKKK